MDTKYDFIKNKNYVDRHNHRAVMFLVFILRLALVLFFVLSLVLVLVLLLVFVMFLVSVLPLSGTRSMVVQTGEGGKEAGENFWKRFYLKPTVWMVVIGFVIL